MSETNEDKIKKAQMNGGARPECENGGEQAEATESSAQAESRDAGAQAKATESPAQAESRDAGAQAEALESEKKPDKEEALRKNRRAVAIPAVAVVILLVVIMILMGRGAHSGDRLAHRDPVDAYMKVLSRMEEPSGYKNTDKLKYISIDTRRMIGSSEEERTRLLEQVAETYGVEVLDMNMVMLSRKGYLTDNRFIGGMLFRITDTQFEKDPVKIQVLEWLLDSNGAVNREFTLEYPDKQWEITDVKELSTKELL